MEIGSLTRKATKLEVVAIFLAMTLAVSAYSKNKLDEIRAEFLEIDEIVLRNNPDLIAEAKTLLNQQQSQLIFMNNSLSYAALLTEYDKKRVKLKEDLKQCLTAIDVCRHNLTAACLYKTDDDFMDIFERYLDMMAAYGYGVKR